MGARGKYKEHSDKCQHKDAASAVLSRLLLTLHSHRITLSARASTFGGIVRPICFAVFRFITSSNLVGRSTGKSAGFAPFRILSTYTAARRCESVILGP